MWSDLGVTWPSVTWPRFALTCVWPVSGRDRSRSGTPRSDRASVSTRDRKHDTGEERRDKKSSKRSTPTEEIETKKVSTSRRNARGCLELIVGGWNWLYFGDAVVDLCIFAVLMQFRRLNGPSLELRASFCWFKIVSFAKKIDDILLVLFILLHPCNTPVPLQVSRRIERESDEIRVVEDEYFEKPRRPPAPSPRTPSEASDVDRGTGSRRLALRTARVGHSGGARR